MHIVSSDITYIQIVWTSIWQGIQHLVYKNISSLLETKKEAKIVRSCSYFLLFSSGSKLKNHKVMYSSIFIQNFRYQRQDILLHGSVCILQAKTYSSSLVSVLHNTFSFFRIIRWPVSSTSHRVITWSYLWPLEQPTKIKPFSEILPPKNIFL